MKFKNELTNLITPEINIHFVEDSVYFDLLGNYIYIYSLHAELDKRGFYKELNSIPDFLFHKQGTYENHCVMEVKATLDNCEGIIKDF